MSKSRLRKKLDKVYPNGEGGKGAANSWRFERMFDKSWDGVGTHQAPIKGVQCKICLGVPHKYTPVFYRWESDKKLFHYKGRDRGWVQVRYRDKNGWHEPLTSPTQKGHDID